MAKYNYRKLDMFLESVEKNEGMSEAVEKRGIFEKIKDSIVSSILLRGLKNKYVLGDMYPKIDSIAKQRASEVTVNKIARLGSKKAYLNYIAEYSKSKELLSLMDSISESEEWKMILVILAFSILFVKYLLPKYDQASRGEGLEQDQEISDEFSEGENMDHLESLIGELVNDDEYKKVKVIIEKVVKSYLPKLQEFFNANDEEGVVKLAGTMMDSIMEKSRTDMPSDVVTGMLMSVIADSQ
jgi:hypothetical protein